MLRKMIFSLLVASGLFLGASTHAQAQFGGALGRLREDTNRTSPAKSATLVENCELSYRRADGAFGFGMLDPERLALKPTEAKAFVTDWRFEKTRTDGSTHYGSHGRELNNRGQRVLKITYKADPVNIVTVYLDPGAGRSIRADIVEVACP